MGRNIINQTIDDAGNKSVWVRDRAWDARPNGGRADEIDIMLITLNYAKAKDVKIISQAHDQDGRKYIDFIYLKEETIK